MIRVNGEDMLIQEICLIDLLENLGYNPKRIAVELNGCIVKRSSFKETEIKDGDKVEIVCFVGGG